MTLRLEKLSLANFADYESLTACQADGGCYCSFWHQKWTSMDDWMKCQKETPDLNRSMVYEKVRSGFHVGVLAYLENELVAWVSIGPIPEFYWTWRRVAQIGENSRSVAGILCMTVAEKFRGKGFQKELLEELKVYGKNMGWKSIEGYPFDMSAIAKQGRSAKWPGLPKGFEEASFSRIESHWLSSKDWERSIYKFDL